MGFVRSRARDIGETAALLDAKAAQYGEPGDPANPALTLARLLRNRIGIFYSSTDRFDSVNTRWRGQMAENAKTLAFGHVLPEMNHNEIVGWKTLMPQMREMQVVFLRDKEDHPRVQRRMEVTSAILAAHTDRITEVWSEGESLLARIFSLVHLGDWVSLYLAVLHGVDPTPVEAINRLKEELAKS
jgi:glucose/mannose-6-phosphate isomerase